MVVIIKGYLDLLDQLSSSPSPILSLCQTETSVSHSYYAFYSYSILIIEAYYFYSILIKLRIISSWERDCKYVYAVPFACPNPSLHSF